MATIYDVAQRAGVSVATVSRFLTGNGYVGDDARTRVANAVNALGFVPNRAAASLKTKMTGMIGLVVSNLNSQFNADIAAWISRAARTRGYAMILSEIADRPELASESVAMMRTHGIDGLIITPPESPELINVLADLSKEIPVVGLGLRTSPLLFDVVTTDTFTGARHAVAHLIAQGHDRIAYVGTANTSVGRYRGYLQALVDAGMTVAPELVRDGPLNPRFGERAITTLLSENAAPTAVFTMNDDLALGVIQGAKACGLVLPDLLSVVGYDDIPLAHMASPPLTTVSQPTELMAEQAVKRITERLDGTAKDARPEVFSFEGSLVIRESTSAVMKTKGEDDE